MQKLAFPYLVLCDDKIPHRSDWLISDFSNLDIYFANVHKCLFRCLCGCNNSLGVITVVLAASLGKCVTHCRGPCGTALSFC